VSSKLNAMMALVAMLSAAIPPSMAQANPDYDLQERCGAASRVAFEAHQAIDSAVESYQNNYSSKHKSCFMLETIVRRDNNKATERLVILIDVLRNNTIGFYSYLPEKKDFLCMVDGNDCANIPEFNRLTASYMD
jgi:hypothetical protein